jgi:hypothetical protein
MERKSKLILKKEIISSYYKKFPSEQRGAKVLYQGKLFLYQEETFQLKKEVGVDTVYKEDYLEVPIFARFEGTELLESKKVIKL